MTDDHSDLDRYPKPSLAVDPVLLTVSEGRLRCMLWRRSNPPDEGKFALPGAFVNYREELEDAVSRALRSKVGIDREVRCRQMFAWNKADRDQRGWVVTIAYVGLTEPGVLDRAASNRDDCMVASIEERDGKALAFTTDGKRIHLPLGHEEILLTAILTLRDEIWTSREVLGALPKHFTLREMQSVYEAVLGTSLNKDSFRRRVSKTSGIVRGTGKLQDNVDHRPAELYRRAM